MKGNNMISVCSAQLTEMVQHYFDTQMFKDGQSPTVTGIVQDSQASVFRIQTVSKEAEPATKAGKP